MCERCNYNYRMRKINLLKVYLFCICVKSCKNYFYDLMEYITILIQSNVKKQKCDELDPLYCEEEDILVKALNIF